MKASTRVSIRASLRVSMLVLLLAGLAPRVSADDVRTPAEHRRGAEQTFLTYPEWFLVHSPAELATYLAAGRPPSSFPWLGHVGQFWQGYRAVTRETADQPFNAGYHLMVAVIGISTTVEYLLRGAYESTIGRLSETTEVTTEEDRLAARVAQQYVDFIRVDPWYLFDFVAPLQALWRDVPMTGAAMPRKWERRYLLSTEWLVKAGYAWVIRQATGAIYEAARPVTAVVLNAAPRPSPSLPELQRLPGPEGVYTVPRYRAFMAYAGALAAQGLDFVEIAGNRGEILASVIRRSGQPASDGTRAVLVQPVLSQPGRERHVVAVAVPQLAAQLRRWQTEGVEVEHVYDY